MSRPIDAVYIRALTNARGAGLCGIIVPIGMETRAQRELVELGHLWQELHGGTHYRFTISPSGRDVLDGASATRRRTGT